VYSVELYTNSARRRTSITGNYDEQLQCSAYADHFWSRGSGWVDIIRRIYAPCCRGWLQTIYKPLWKRRATEDQRVCRKKTRGNWVVIRRQQL